MSYPKYNQDDFMWCNGRKYEILVTYRWWRLVRDCDTNVCYQNFYRPHDGPNLVPVP